MDQFDRAAELEQLHRDAAIARARSGQELLPRHARSGPLRWLRARCLWCDDESIVGGRRFCDAECRDGFESERMARARAGLSG